MDPNLTNTITDFVMYDSDLQAVDSCDPDAFDFDAYSFIALFVLLVYGFTKYMYPHVLSASVVLIPNQTPARRSM